MKSDLRWLRPMDVTIDHTVQRGLDKTHVNRIAKGYDPLLFGIGHVSLRPDGRYYVSDSQHRCAAAVECGKGDVAVLFNVYTGLTVEQEAELFLKLNAHKKAVSVLDNFNISVRALHPVHLDIVRILNIFGLRVAGHRTDGGIAAVSTLLKLYQARTEIQPLPNTKPLEGAQYHLLVRTLDILCTAYKRERNAYDSVMMNGIAGLLVKHGTRVDAKEMSRKLSRDTPGVALARISGGTYGGKKSKVLAAVEYFESVYDQGRHKNRLVP